MQGPQNFGFQARGVEWRIYSLCKICQERAGTGLRLCQPGLCPLIETHTSISNESVMLQLVVSEDGTELTGELTGPIVHAERKALLLEEIVQKEGIHLKQTIAIGDGVNDLVMMQKAGLGVAFNAKPKVQAEAPCRLNSPTLKDILYILGFAKGEQDDLLALSS